MKAETGGSLAGWGLRDLSIMTISAAIILGLGQWQAATASTTSHIVGAAAGFVIGYVLCYIVHEWGHLIGAKLSGSVMPLSRYSSPLIGSFDIYAHNRRQFLAMSWGGIAGYVLVGALLVTLYFVDYRGTVSGGLAVAGLAFNVQSLCVDLPQIVRVQRLQQSRSDIAETNRTGASGAVILKRTGQSWAALALLLALWHLT